MVVSNRNFPFGKQDFKYLMGCKDADKINSELVYNKKNI